MITLTSVHYVPHEAALQHLLRSKTGTVGRDIERRAVRVLIAAKFQVGTTSRRLKRSLHVEMRSRPHVEALVGSNVRYSYMHHEGTRAHPIVARPGRMLSFRVDGRRVVVRKVLHPGTKPNRYLTDNLFLAIK